MSHQPQTVRFRIANPDRDARRILVTLRAYWERTGYLPRLERVAGAFWLRAPHDVAAEWVLAFGVVAESH